MFPASQPILTGTSLYSSFKHGFATLLCSRFIFVFCCVFLTKIEVYFTIVITTNQINVAPIDLDNKKSVHGRVKKKYELDY